MDMPRVEWDKLFPNLIGMSEVIFLNRVPYWVDSGLWGARPGKPMRGSTCI